MLSEVFDMKRYIHATEDIFAMFNVRGKYIKVEKEIPFSFYYSPRNSSHGPRVKPVMNPSKMNLSDAGVLMLCNNWDFIPGAKDQHCSSSLIKEMKNFFRKYLVLFLLVWDNQIDDPELEDYFRGDITLNEFIRDIDFYNDYKEDLDEINDVTSLEDYCREHNLVNFYGN